MRTISVGIVSISITNIIVAFINICEHNRFAKGNWIEQKTILASLKILDIWKFHIFALRWRDKIRRSSQLRTLLRRVVVNRTWKKFQARTGFEPMTSAIPVQRSTNWANKPTGSWSMNWVQINIQVNEELDVWKFTYLDLRTLLRYFNFIPLKNLDFGLFFCTSSGQTTRCPDNFHTSDLLYSKIYVTCSGLYYHKILNGQYKPKLVP